MTATIRGGDLVATRVGEIVKRFSGSPEVRVGFLEGATYPDGTSVAAVAAAQEFGTRTIPSRPFFRNMIRAKRDSWGPAVAALLVRNGYDVERTLGQTGAAIAAQLQDSIVQMNDPPLAPATLAARRYRAKGATPSTKVLVDTGHLLASVSYEVST